MNDDVNANIVDVSFNNFSSSFLGNESQRSFGTVTVPTVATNPMMLSFLGETILFVAYLK